MRYGAVPVVRSVGGLADTVIDEQDVVRAAAANGFCFKEPVDPSELMDLRQGAELLVSTVRRALNTHGTPRWDELLINGLIRDSSWEVPAAQYMKLYHEAIRRRVDSSFFGSAAASTASA